MTVVGLILLTLTHAAQSDDTSTRTVTLAMVAVQATNEGCAAKTIDPRLNSVRRAIEGLDYDTFSLIRQEEKAHRFGVEARITINDRYTLYITPKEIDDNGRVVIDARIATKTRDGRDVNALNTTLRMAPGKPLNLGGCPLSPGELIVVLSVR